MKYLTKLLKLQTDDELFEQLQSTFKEKITQLNYFVNWNKVLKNVNSIEKELNLLNYLIGKEDIRKELIFLIEEYPSVIKTFPFLLAIREKSVDILIDVKKIYIQEL